MPQFGSVNSCRLWNASEHRISVADDDIDEDLCGC
jgi:hypothetical protein